MAAAMLDARVTAIITMATVIGIVSVTATIIIIVIIVITLIASAAVNTLALVARG